MIPSLRSTIARRLAACALLLGAATVAACNVDRTVSPTAEPGAAAFARGGVNNGGTLAGTLTTSGDALIRKTALAWPIPRLVAVSRSYKVPQNTGSTLEFPEVGLKVQVPSGAIPTSSMVITITALPGVGVAYSFEPHGTQFRKPLIVHQDLSFTSWAGSTGRGTIGAGYFANDRQVNPRTGVVTLDEVLTAKITGNRAHFEVKHFSGYMVSMD